MEPDFLFAGSESEEPLVDLEGLQFETAAEGALSLLLKCIAGRIEPIGVLVRIPFHSSFAERTSLDLVDWPTGGRLRRDVMSVGGVAPIGGKSQDSKLLQARLGGLEEQVIANTKPSDGKRCCTKHLGSLTWKYTKDLLMLQYE